jgi:dihydroorotase-like cyclic amidohydrolase
VLTEGPLRKFTPPARIRSEVDRDRMWEAVRSGAFSHFSTDHAPSTLAQKGQGGIWDAPFGLPGIDTTFPFLLDAALSGRIGLEDVARLYSLAPAVRYGLAPRKGAIAVGADADLVLVDPEAAWTVSDADVLSKAGWSPYAGTTFRGRVVATFLRGQEIARDGTPHDARTGRFLAGAGV